MTIAVTRGVSSRINDCEITHIERSPIDVGIARHQHSEYVKALIALGCQVVELPEEPDLPDSVFVEDTAIILPEVAIITRPGADSRKPETESIGKILSKYRPLKFLKEPAIADGGDILVLGKDIYIGLSTRSNRSAIAQIQTILDPYEYRVQGVNTKDCLHLKSAVTRINDDTILINKNWLDCEPFKKYIWVEPDVSEPFGANCLPINDEIVYPTSFPKTCFILESKGYAIRSVTVDELAKAEGAVTCCSLIISQ
jgi:dimethylargininase